jgi:hypothetical protein
MSQRTCSLLASLLLATLMGAPRLTQHAEVRRTSANTLTIVCTQTPAKKDAEQIREGVRTRDGKMVFAGAEACSRDFRKKGSGTVGRVGAQTWSTSQLPRWKWKSGKSTATGTRNNAFFFGRIPKIRPVQLRTSGLLATSASC